MRVDTATLTRIFRPEMNTIHAYSLPTLAFSFMLAVPFSPGEALRPGDRALPGLEPSLDLSYAAPTGTTQVTVRHSESMWVDEYAMAHTDSLWRISLPALGWEPGHYHFKFMVNGEWEEGPNRYAYVGTNGLLQRPPARYLTWQRDPTTTMTVHWHGDAKEDPSFVDYRRTGESRWLTSTGFSVNLPDTPRFVHTVELTGLTPGSDYEFRLPMAGEVFWFRTLPARLEHPLRFVEGGDVYEVGGLMDMMNRMAGALDPAFAVIGGDLAYTDGLPERAQRWYRYMASFTENLVAPDGRMIPVILAIGNHEVQRNYVESHPDYRPGPAWRQQVAPQFFKLFSFPGHPGYGVLDIGDYLSFIALDTHHANPVDGEQLEWLRARLAERKGIPHLFPIYHVPAYPSVRSPYDTRATLIRQLWVPLFEEAGIHLAFEHHDHAFKITYPMKSGKVDPDGIVFVGDGAWGVNVRIPNVHPAQAAYLRKAMPINHLFEITLTPSNRLIRALDINGTVLDQFIQ